MTEQSILSKTPKITLLLYLIGIGGIVSSTIRWYIVYPDYSNLFLAMGLGISVLIFGYIYAYMRENSDNLIRMQRQMDTIGAFVTNNMEEAVKEEMFFPRYEARNK